MIAKSLADVPKRACATQISKHLRIRSRKCLQLWETPPVLHIDRSNEVNREDHVYHCYSVLSLGRQVA